jgi:NAD(P)-dependent dehydrogenase (short-subunit alcohol dehydrogenase family)
MERLDGKRIVITGGTSGMGEGVVRAFPALGAKVVFWGRNEAAGKKIAEETGAIFVKADVSDKATVDEAMKKSAEILGRSTVYSIKVSVFFFEFGNLSINIFKHFKRKLTILDKRFTVIELLKFIKCRYSE